MEQNGGSWAGERRRGGGGGRGEWGVECGAHAAPRTRAGPGFTRPRRCRSGLPSRRPSRSSGPFPPPGPGASSIPSHPAPRLARGAGEAGSAAGAHGRGPGVCRRPAGSRPPPSPQCPRGGEGGKPLAGCPAGTPWTHRRPSANNKKKTSLC
jgi:hypothetical protein